MHNGEATKKYEDWIKGSGLNGIQNHGCPDSSHYLGLGMVLKSLLWDFSRPGYNSPTTLTG